ncbi:MAG: hypothetical protein JJU05_18960, partial [Verrucomicrobia bacterium]|nr:hypothetical protein [Verrucomicrobiota bacterium]
MRLQARLRISYCGVRLGSRPSKDFTLPARLPQRSCSSVVLVIHHSSFVTRHSSLVIRHSSL